MSWTQAVITMVLGFVFSALFSGAETGGYTINRIRLRLGVRKRNRAALTLSHVLEDPHRFVFTVLIGNNIAVYFLSKTVTDLYLACGLRGGGTVLGFIPWSAETAATLTLTFPLFIFAELLPKNLFRKKADVWMYRLAGLLRLLMWLFAPLTVPLERFFRLLTGGRDDPGCELHRLSPDGLKEYFSEGARDGVLTSHQSRMLDNVSSMHRVRVRAVMTPLRETPRLSREATVADFRRVCARRKVPYALLLDRLKPEGIVHIFPVVRRGLSDDTPVAPYAEEVMKIPENRNLKSAFYRLRRHPRHCAAVVDGRGHVVGFVRLADIARYISAD